jgi:hypothetical protein
MANYCSNSVLFVGDEQSVAQIKALFEDIEKKQNKSGLWHMPSFIESDGGFMLDIVIDKRAINYETRWVPNLEVLAQIADKYQVGFIGKFQEMGNGIYGEAAYREGKLSMVTLTKEELASLHYDKTLNGYLLGDQVYEYEGDLLDVLLEQKKLLESSNYNISR